MPRLQLSVMLGKSKPALRKRVAGESVAGFGETHELRLERNLRSNAAIADTGLRPALPSGDLNPGGLVRASRMRIRDGAVFLEGDGSVQSAASLADLTSATAVPPDKAAQIGRQD
ncbi:MAG: hypothetical protein M0Z99_14535 [Betaproteobacteria bacterium]|nr:hypothetical protein [Betaproteobacteria bacterium]